MLAGPRMVVLVGVLLIGGAVALVVSQAQKRALITEPSAEPDVTETVDEIVAKYQEQQANLDRPSDDEDGGGLSSVGSYSHSRAMTSLPKTGREVHDAFMAIQARSCEVLPPTKLLNYAGGRAQRSDETFNAVVLTVGLKVSATDQAQLPKLSRGSIVNYLRENFIGIQVKIERDDAGRPLIDDHAVAGLCRFAAPTLTADPYALIVQSIKDIRVLGVYPGRFKASAARLAAGPEVPATEPADVQEKTPKPSDSQTLVMLHGHRQLSPTAAASSASAVWEGEFVFLHALAAEPDRKDVGPFMFVTSENRTKLHKVKIAYPPSSVTSCDVQADITFTAYEYGGQLPKESAVRRSLVFDEWSVSVADADRWVKDQGLEGGALDNLTAVLDRLATEGKQALR